MIFYEDDRVTIQPIDGSDCEWGLFFLFGVIVLLADPVWWDSHVDWIRRRPFESPDEYLGPEGIAFRKRQQMDEPSAKFKSRWTDFSRKHRLATADQITGWIQALVNEFDDEPQDRSDFEERLAEFFRDTGSQFIGERERLLG
jgi:hypothetical protein